VNHLKLEERNDQMQVRIDKLNQLREQGIDPFGKKYERTHQASEILAQYKEYSKEELEEIALEVSIAGRLMTKRVQGKASFAHLQDGSGRIQTYVRLDQVGEHQYQLFRTADIGDFLGIKGVVFKTNRGEVSVKAQEVVHLSKSLRPLPEKYH